MDLKCGAKVGIDKVERHLVVTVNRYRYVRVIGIWMEREVSEPTDYVTWTIT